LTVSCGSYEVRFYPAAYSATLWLNPKEHLADENVLRCVLHKDDCVIDIGANIGVLTLAASRIVGNTGRVYSVEAHPRTYRYLLGNLKLNRVVNVSPLNVACGSHNGTVRFSDRKSDDQNAVSPDGLSVPVRRMDELIPQSEEIALLKVDVEGYEKFVFEGAVGILPRVKTIYFESCRQHFASFGYHLSDIVDLLADFQFQIFRLNGESVNRAYESEVCENLLATRTGFPKTLEAAAQQCHEPWFRSN
jgi:FkbM family methyltransferase